MGNWLPILVLGLTQFVMVLDGTVMNVSISAVVADLGTTVSAMQLAIATFTLTMAAFMLAGAGLGTRLGRRRTFLRRCGAPRNTWAASRRRSVGARVGLPTSPSLFYRCARTHARALAHTGCRY